MKYIGKKVRVLGIEGIVVAEDITHIKIVDESGQHHIVDKINNIITIVSLAIRLADLLAELWNKIKSRFK